MKARKNELPANEMLTARSDFLAIQSKGKRWVSNSFILQIRNNNLKTIRIGYTVSKKVDKSAVKRNRIKRRLRSVVAELLPYMENGYDYILVGRKQTACRSYNDLTKDFKWCLRKMDLYKSKADS